MAIAACERQGCDARLLIAIGLVETGGRKDPDDTWHHDKVSWGRYGMQTTTGAFHLLGYRYSDPDHLPGHLALEVQRALMDPLVGAELAAEHLAWCQHRPWVRRGRNPRANAALCWNPRDAAYPARVMKKYREIGR